MIKTRAFLKDFIVDFHPTYDLVITVMKHKIFHKNMLIIEYENVKRMILIAESNFLPFTWKSEIFDLNLDDYYFKFQYNNGDEINYFVYDRTFDHYLDSWNNNDEEKFRKYSKCTTQ